MISPVDATARERPFLDAVLFTGGACDFLCHEASPLETPPMASPASPPRKAPRHECPSDLEMCESMAGPAAGGGAPGAETKVDTEAHLRNVRHYFEGNFHLWRPENLHDTLFGPKTRAALRETFRAGASVHARQHTDPCPLVRSVLLKGGGQESTFWSYLFLVCDHLFTKHNTPDAVVLGGKGFGGTFNECVGVKAPRSFQRTLSQDKLPEKVVIRRQRDVPSRQRSSDTLYAYRQDSAVDEIMLHLHAANCGVGLLPLAAFVTWTKGVQEQIVCKHLDDAFEACTSTKRKKRQELLAEVRRGDASQLWRDLCPKMDAVDAQQGGFPTLVMVLPYMEHIAYHFLNDQLRDTGLTLQERKGRFYSFGKAIERLTRKVADAQLWLLDFSLNNIAVTQEGGSLTLHAFDLDPQWCYVTRRNDYAAHFEEAKRPNRLMHTALLLLFIRAHVLGSGVRDANELLCQLLRGVASVAQTKADILDLELRLLGKLERRVNAPGFEDNLHLIVSSYGGARAREFCKQGLQNFSLGGAYKAAMPARDALFSHLTRSPLQGQENELAVHV